MGSGSDAEGMRATTVLLSLLTRIRASGAAGTTWRRLVVSFAASRRATDTAWGLFAGVAWAPLAAPVIRAVVRTVATSICRVRCMRLKYCAAATPRQEGLFNIRYQSGHGFHVLAGTKPAF